MQIPLPSPKRLIQYLTVAYAGFSTCWIIAVDALLNYLVDDPNQLAQLQSLKNLLFILVSSGGLYLLLRWSWAQLQQARLQELDESEAGFWVLKQQGCFCNLVAAKVAPQLPLQEGTALHSPYPDRQTEDSSHWLRAVLAPSQLGPTQYLPRNQLAQFSLHFRSWKEGVTVSLVYNLKPIQPKLEPLEKWEQHYQWSFALNSQPMWIYEQQTLRFLAVNQAAIAQFGYSPAELLQMRLSDLVTYQFPCNVLKAVVPLPNSVKGIAGIWKPRCKDGTRLEMEGLVYPLLYANCSAQLMMLTTISDCQQMELRLQRSAFSDPLTNLPNQRWLLERLEQYLESEACFALLLLELERLETIKYSFGHALADRLLIATAQRWQDDLALEEPVARVGDQSLAFVLLTTSTRDATAYAERIHGLSKIPFKIEGHEVLSPVRIGVALSSFRDNPEVECSRPEDLLRAADTAVNYAKAHREVPWTVYHPQMHERAIAQLRLETELHRALKPSAQPQLRVFYQPTVALTTGEIVGFEALLRWQHPTLGLVHPQQFLPLAEETGLLGLIDWWVLEEACQQLSQWQRLVSGSQPLTISVNLSGQLLAQESFVERLESVLGATALSPSSLKLEVTETMLFSDQAAAMVIFKQLRALGIRFAIDDFGTGHSSLERLHQLPVDTLKIDRSFVARMLNETESLEIVRTIIDLAHTLALEVVAEGVETSEQVRKLRSLECEYGQGYLFAQPLPPQQARQVLLQAYKSLV